jgi:hypothetical protein
MGERVGVIEKSAQRQCASHGVAGALASGWDGRARGAPDESGVDDDDGRRRPPAFPLAHGHVDALPAPTGQAPFRRPPRPILGCDGAWSSCQGVKPAG